ncbi:hypothetical protein GLYMA_04G102100v4 [Glycine max]|uniref:Uncharacterized protein n=2 Tax=Glycine max TaxID=3847 RepID=A0A0R0K6N4_SOYBN|nr:protein DETOXIFICATION 10 [Glycine max]KAH1110759.1 hypothetical protein GYH30_009526 [Glycine max]KAH1253342.1 Protein DETOXIFICATION 12 [Glycine max]KRH62349.1 hypothetical protein GLYMA_04G102100v4 [Glycine max]
MLITSCVTLCVRIPLCWVLVFKTRQNNVGGALAMSISIWSNVFFHGLYMRYSPTCAKTGAPIFMELFQRLWEFFRFAIPSAVMICLEWWPFELIILLSGLLLNPQLETSVLSVCTRISNELGVGNPRGARVSVRAAMPFAVVETTIVSGTLFACRHVFGYIFSNEKEVVDSVTLMAPLVCIWVILDNIQGVLAGVARGC